MTNPSYIYNEHEVLIALKQGSEKAFTQIYHQYSVPLYQNILSLVKDEHSAEELVQDVFFKLWKQRETITIEKNLAGYLFVMARNRVYDFFIQITRDKALYKKVSSRASGYYHHIEEIITTKENVDLLKKAIATLPPQRRKAFELCKLEGLTYQQASEEMGISLSTLKDHMINALDAVRLYLSKNMEMPGVLALGLFFTLF